MKKVRSVDLVRRTFSGKNKGNETRRIAFAAFVLANPTGSASAFTLAGAF